MYYTFSQNNSGGFFIVNKDVGEYLIIEASTEEEAIIKMREITKNHSKFCKCCGERWSTRCHAEEHPSTNDEDVHSYNGSTVIYHLDGRIERRKHYLKRG